MVVIQPSTRLIKPNFCFPLSHRRRTTVSLETRNPFSISWIVFNNNNYFKITKFESYSYFWSVQSLTYLNYYSVIMTCSQGNVAIKLSFRYTVVLKVYFNQKCKYSIAHIIVIWQSVKLPLYTSAYEEIAVVCEIHSTSLRVVMPVFVATKLMFCVGFHCYSCFSLLRNWLLVFSILICHCNNS